MCTNFEVIWKFLSSCISWVHCDEDGTRWIQRQFRSFEHKPTDSLVDGDLDTLDLLSDDGKHFQFDPVEFIEARPSARLSQAFEEFAHRFVVESIRTVENHALAIATKQKNISHKTTNYVTKFTGCVGVVGGTPTGISAVMCPSIFVVRDAQQRRVTGLSIPFCCLSMISAEVFHCNDHIQLVLVVGVSAAYYISRHGRITITCDG